MKKRNGIDAILIANLIRKPIYRMGYRPKRGSIFYSPHLMWQYALKDANLDKAFKKAYSMVMEGKRR